jgi:transposase-like protein
MNTGLAVRTVNQAENVIKSMRLRGFEWDDGYRDHARDALKDVLHGRMDAAISEHLAEVSGGDVPDRRNGSYSRWLLTELGSIELHVPRTRHYSASKALGAYARRPRHIDHLVLACFVLGLSTRKVGKALAMLLGERVSPTTVSRVTKTLDEAVSAFHRRRLHDSYRVLLLDGVVLSRKTGAGALKRPVLTALGIKPDGRKEVIDYRLASSESEAEWEMFLSDMYNRGLTGENLELGCTDGGKGLLAALGTVLPSVPIQRCWAHKTRNLTDKSRETDREDIKKNLHEISHAKNIVEARTAARRFADRWERPYPKLVRSLREDLDSLLEFFRFDTDDWRKMCRTTNAIERRFREVRRRTRPMGVFSDRTSMDRILYAIFANENQNQESNTPFLLTHNS